MSVDTVEDSILDLLKGLRVRSATCASRYIGEPPLKVGYSGGAVFAVKRGPLTALPKTLARGFGSTRSGNMAR